MSAGRVRPTRTHLRASDVRGLAHLATAATTGVADIAEGVHQSVLRTLGVAGPQGSATAGITGLVYQSVRAITRLVGTGLDRALMHLEASLATSDDTLPGSPQRDVVLAALNGVIGDRLVAAGSPLATTMSLWHEGVPVDLQSPLALPGATSKVVLLVHGLCMDEHRWRTRKRGRVVDHGATLASAFRYTPVYLRYNSGLHVSENGRQLSDLLEALAVRWPIRIDDLTVVAHSMGGLVIRSAAHDAARHGRRWLGCLRRMVFLGTPHHGAPLERAGNRIDVILESTPYTAPFAALGRVRSAGITDLRYGHVVEEDWLGRDRFHRLPDTRVVVPLPASVSCYAIAATRAARRRPLADRLIGDGLVPVPSALGQHPEARRCLAFAEAAQWVAYRTNHLQLLSSGAVGRQLVSWLAIDQDRARVAPQRPRA
jgi:pimeloyl-ACP methyl ester carboxylesterase